MVWVPRGILVLLLAVAACSDDDTASPADTTAESTTTTAPETTTTTDPPPDPSVIPDDPADIDEEYVEAVLAELMHLNGEVLRIARRDGASPLLAERITAIFENDVEAARLQFLAEAVASDFEGYADPPGDIVVDVTALVDVSTECVSVDVLQDFRAVGPEGEPAVQARVELIGNDTPSPFNTTAWVISLMQPTAQDEAPPPCAG